MNLPDTFPQWLGAGFSAGGGAAIAVYLIKILLEWLGGRVDKKEAAVERGFERLDAGTQKLIQHLERQIAELTQREAAREKRLENVEAELLDCKRKHAESESELGRLKAIIQGSGEVREHVQRILAAESLVQKGGGDGRT